MSVYRTLLDAITAAMLARRSEWARQFEGHHQPPSASECPVEFMAAAALNAGWLPLDTAPKDGSRVHLGFQYLPGFDVIAHWDDGSWALDGNGDLATRLNGRPEPAAWRPLPPAPGIIIEY